MSSAFSALLSWLSIESEFLCDSLQIVNRQFRTRTTKDYKMDLMVAAMYIPHLVPKGLENSNTFWEYIFSRLDLSIFLSSNSASLDELGLDSRRSNE